MTSPIRSLIPEIYVTTPRRTPAVPNSNGTLAIYKQSIYDLRSISTTVEYWILNLQTEKSLLFTSEESIQDVTWIGETSLIGALKNEDNGTTRLIVGDGADLEKGCYEAGKYKGPVNSLKIVTINDKLLAITVVGEVTPHGMLYNPKMAPKSYSTGREYTAMSVRDYDKWLTPQRDTIWYATLVAESLVTGRYHFLDDPINVLEGTGLDLSAGAGFDVSRTGVLFAGRQLTVKQGTTFKYNAYYVATSSLMKLGIRKPSALNLAGLEGASSSPVFSPDGQSAAFLQKRKGSYDDVKSRLFLVRNINGTPDTTEMFSSVDGKGSWSLSPRVVKWSKDGKEIYMTAEQDGRIKLFKLPILSSSPGNNPSPLSHQGGIEAVYPFASDVASKNMLLVTKSSFIDDSTYETLDPATGKSNMISSANRNGATLGLHSSQVEEVHFQGAEDHEIHAWVIKPSDFDVSKKYPLLYAIHGGPSNAWNDHWWGGTWNLAVFAEQGYVVFAPNITGSTGFGEDFAQRAYNNCGGLAYEDLVQGLSFVKRKLDFVDTNRAVALGISYGGYLVNWIAGHPLGKEFKALVADCGIFSTLNMYAQDNSWFQADLFKGTIYGARENYERWDPARYVSNWTTPQLIIANELDYRVPISEGLAAFHILQARGVESRFLSFPDEGHLVQKPGNQLHWLRTVLGWCNHYVNPVIEGEREGKLVLGNAVSEPGWRV
ncbi:hypothetical protein MMC17_004089 [Xylographa soralifera]|nr:hypothetical protein [Xylographa soralifera]